nr:hypothetical protein [Lupinus angustifolius]
MERGRSKRFKTTAQRTRRPFTASYSNPSVRHNRGDPYYSLILQETRLSKFQGRKPTYIRYADLTWMAEQNFEFLQGMQAQGVVMFMELMGNMYPALIREIYANFRYKDGKYWSIVSGNLFEMNSDIFMNVGGFSTNGASLGECEWLKDFDAAEENTMINWPEEILKIMYNVSTSQSKLLPYSIFISRIIDYLHIDVSDTIITETSDKDHLVGESLIHKMGIYKYGSTWQYQEDYTTVDLDLYDDEDQADADQPHVETQGKPTGNTLQEPSFRLAQLDAMEQRLNNRKDLYFLSLKDSYHKYLEQFEEHHATYIDNHYQAMRSFIQNTIEE